MAGKALQLSELPVDIQDRIRRGEVVEVRSGRKKVATISPPPGYPFMALAGTFSFDGRLDAEAIDEALDGRSERLE